MSDERLRPGEKAVNPRRGASIRRAERARRKMRQELQTQHDQDMITKATARQVMDEQAFDPILGMIQMYRECYDREEWGACIGLLRDLARYHSPQLAAMQIKAEVEDKRTMPVVEIDYMGINPAALPEDIDDAATGP